MPSPPRVCAESRGDDGRSRAGVTPLSPDRYKIQLTIGGDTLEKLRLAKDMLRHAIPSGDDAAILDRALTALLANLARKKFAASGSRSDPELPGSLEPRPGGTPGVCSGAPEAQPRPPRATAPGTRHIPAHVKRAVWLRDLGRCAFVAKGDVGGRRCNERGFLEFHHVQPFAAGGMGTIENTQLRCRRHNDYESRVDFGPGGPHGGRSVVREAAVAYGLRPFDTTTLQLVPERVRVPMHCYS